MTDIILEIAVRTASAITHPCEMYRDHGSARPVVTQGHHAKPVYLQNRLYGKIVDGTLIWLCGTCHDNVHAWLYWILRERRFQPLGTPARAVAAAEKAMDWYVGELAKQSGASTP